MSDTERQAAHAALFRRVAEHLAVMAGKLTRIDEDPRLDPLDVATLFLGTAVDIMVTIGGKEMVIAYLRETSDGMESGQPRAH